MNNSCDKILKVLYVLSDSAVHLIESRAQPPNTVDDYVDFTNHRLQRTINNSGLGGTKTVQSVVMQGRNYSGIRLNCSQAAGDLRTNPQAIADRQAHDADLLVYYKATVGPYCEGVAADVGASYDHAYALVEAKAEVRDAYVGIWNTHEIGHLLGGLHSDAFEIIPPSYPWLATEMRPDGNINSSRRIEHFSNPYVTYTNAPLGVYDEPTGADDEEEEERRFNAAAIGPHFCVMADYEHSGTTSVQMLVSGKYGCEGPFRINNHVIPGSSGGPNAGPYSYLYEYAHDPSGPWQYARATSSAWNFSNPGSGSAVYLRLTISNNQGFSTSTTRVLNFCSIYNFPQPAAQVQSGRTALSMGQAYVQQSGKSVTARLVMTESRHVGGNATPRGTDYTWVVTDIYGRPVLSVAHDWTAPDYVELPTDWLPAGAFTITPCGPDGARLGQPSTIVINH